ncbi:MULTISPECIES: carbohydrate ABC transporter permease [Inquilinus]|uniref:Multiple sugar transport system permease protein n=1 Tax=Inquilinus ginsengisoli TaxID=363840 RepID=A0ABU1JGW6_9PROT|nr:sugar ABC transporter permease [Inquilinus ginsengisoli]MDR6287833.1 multiple sugar transport system permease protein [Inquilinus ginsengisoli]
MTSGTAIQDGTAAPRPRRRLSARHREWIAGYLFILPDALGLLLFVGAPMLLSLSLGFFEVSGFGGYRFVGLANYRRMAADPLFLESLRITLAYVAMLVPGLYVSGLGLALLVHRRTRFAGLFRTLFFMPHMVSLVVVGLIWQVLLIDKIGVVSRLSAALGLGGLSWLGDPDLALFAIVGISVWFLMGYYMLIFLSGLQDIPREYHDAARIDGAGPVAAFRYITLPLLRPTSFFVLLVSTVTAVAGMQTFDLIYVMTKGGPANSTALAIYYIYEQAFQFGEYGYAAAMASVLVVILLALTGLLFLLTRGGRFNYD